MIIQKYCLGKTMSIVRERLEQLQNAQPCDMLKVMKVICNYITDCRKFIVSLKELRLSDEPPVSIQVVLLLFLIIWMFMISLLFNIPQMIKNQNGILHTLISIRLKIMF